MSVMIALALAGLLLPGWSAAAEVVDVKVQNVGPGYIDEAFVRAHIGLQKGQELSAAAVAHDVRALLDTERFSDVRVEAEPLADDEKKVVIFVNVRNRLRLAEPVTIKGSKHFEATHIRNVLGVVPGDLVDEAVLAVRAQKVLDEYREDRFTQARIDWTVDVVDTKEGTAVVTGRVVEGPRAKIRSVSFTGNSAVKSGALRDAMKMPVIWNPMTWFSGRQHDAEQIAADRDTTRAMYLDRGYLDVEVGDPEIKEDKTGQYEVTFPVKEGRQYRLRNVRIKGVTLFPELPLLRLVDIKAGDPVSPGRVMAVAEKLRRFYSARGYLRAAVRQSIEPVEGGDPQKALVDVSFAVTEGRLTHVRHVYIRGNTVTHENVVRRELVVYPGEVFDEDRIRISEQRLRNLGFFGKVATLSEPTTREDESDLVFDLQEQRTGTIMLGGGFSSEDSYFVSFEIQEGNFDILSWPPKGAGQKVKLYGQFGDRSTAAEVSFTEPWFMGRRLSLGLDLYGRERDYSEYDERRRGGSVALGKPLEHLFFDRVELRYRLEDIDISGVADTNQYTTPAGEPYFYQYDSELNSRVSVSLSKETRDSVFFPTRGYRASLTGYLAGRVFGGDSSVYGVRVKGEEYVPLLMGHVLALKARAEVVDSYGDTDVPSIYDRLFLGGGRTVRGFGYRDVGPKVHRDVEGSLEQVYRPIGGQTLVNGVVEYVIPVVDRISIALFYDIGDVAEMPYDFDFGPMAQSAGIELRFDAPQFPVKISYAWILNKDEEATEVQPWGFWIGSGF